MPRGVKAAPASSALCREHFPDGWDSPHIWAGHRSVSCEHGEWTREVGDADAVEVQKAVFERDDEEEDDD